MREATEEREASFVTKSFRIDKISKSTFFLLCGCAVFNAAGLMILILLAEWRDQNLKGG